MLRVVALVFALSAAGTMGPSPPIATPPQAEALVAVEKAQNLLAAGNSAAALELAEQLVAQAPFNVEAHHVIQRVYRNRGNSAGLISRYRGLAARYPGIAAAQYLLGNVLLSVEGFQTARPYFDRALELDPRFGWAASINAILNQLDGNVAEALRLGRISAEEITNDPLTAAVYADLLRMNGLREEAIRFLQTAATMNPNEPRYLVELWKLWTRGVEDVEAARAQFAAQLAANRGRFLDTPEHAEMLARFLAGPAMADREASRETWLALAERFPDAAGAKDALLRAAGMTTDLDDKISLYHRILDENPDSSIRYTIYSRLIQDLIRAEEYDRAQRTARGLTTEPDPGRGDSDDLGRNEDPTEWGFTLQGIGYAGWFAAAQAEAGAKNVGWYNIRLGARQRREQPISPEALVAARALDSSGCSDPRTLQYVGQILLNSSYHRALGIRLIERAVQASEGGYPLIALQYGADELAEARADLDRLLDRMPFYYAEAGMLAEAERAVDELLRSLSGDDTGYTHGEVNYLAGYVFERVGRYREAAHHYLIGQWYSTATFEGFEDGLSDLYERIADNDIRRFEPGSGLRMPLAASGIRAFGETSLDGDRLGGDLLLVLFWGTWNQRSIAQVEMLDAMAESLRESGVSSLAVAVQEPARTFVRSTGRTMFSRFLEDHPVKIPLARAELETIERLELVGLPTTFLIDAGGRLLARQLSFGIEPGAWAMQWRDVIDAELERLRPANKRQ